MNASLLEYFRDEKYTFFLVNHGLKGKGESGRKKKADRLGCMKASSGQESLVLDLISS